MRIARIRIQNYRSIKDAEFTVPELCALIGGNNTGKSNILRAVDLVLGDRWPSIKSLDDHDAYGYEINADISISIWFDETRQVRGDIGDPVDYTGIRFLLTRYHRRTGSHEVGDPRSEFVCIDDNGNPVQVLVRPNPRVRPYPRPASVSQEIRESLPVVFVDVDRNASHHLSGSQWSILGRLLKTVAKEFRADQERYESFRVDFDRARQHLHTPSFDLMRTKVIEHLKAHTGLDDIEVILDDVDPINIYKTFSVLFKDPQTPQPVDSERMGTGIQSAVVIALLQTYRELRREDAVLLFEEPELFLHPHGRRHLFRLLCALADSGTQVIYSTHSQDFVDLERLDSIRLASKTAEAGTHIHEPSHEILVEDWREKAKMAKRFGSPRTEILFADSVVLVEGSTEQAAIRLLAELAPDPLELDRLNCSIIDCEGKENLPAMVTIAKSVKKKVLVFYDTDSDKTSPNDISVNERRNEAILAALGTEGQSQSFDPYLEAECGIDGASKKEKDLKMREFLGSISGWNQIPDPLKLMMDRVRHLIQGSEV